MATPKLVTRNTVQGHKYTRPWMYPKQAAAVFDPKRYSVIEASTKSGKTTGSLIWLFEKAAFGGNSQNHWWVAPVYPQSRIAFRRMKNGLPQRIYIANETELTITLKHNQAVIWFKSGDKPDNLYGEDVYSAVIDEASRLKEEAWHAVRSTVTATGGHIRIIGNVRGRKNWAYKLARRAEAGHPRMAYHKITALDAMAAGIFDQAEFEDAQELMPEDVFKQLYLAEAADDEGNPFGISHIRACIAPLSLAPPAVWGWDLAKSHDWTVGTALDEEARVCRFLRWQVSWHDTVHRIKAYSDVIPSLVDSTGVGDPILEELQIYDPVDGGGSNFQGYKFTQSSKQQLMEGLAVTIQRHTISFPDGPIVDELEEFEYVYSRTGVHYSAPEGLFDDCVCSLALAWHLRGTAPSLPFGWMKADPELQGDLLEAQLLGTGAVGRSG